MSEQVYSIKQITGYIKKSLEYDENLSDILLKGEISNFTLHRSGHMYFSLKEDKIILKGVMFQGNARSLKFEPKNGMKVVVRGKIQVYEPSGYYQIVVREMIPDGVGDLFLAYEQLKEKLSIEGLFNEEYKKPIPQFPKKIGIITSPTGAAVHDMITTIERRYPLANILLCPVQVQGDYAIPTIIEAIKEMNKLNEADVLIVGRGGGSIEDLWAFNDEGVARAIFESKIPIISAVGHETDVTIADFVADLRAPTPTGAAEMTTPYTVNELKQGVDYSESKMKKELLNKIKNYRDILEKTRGTLRALHPKKVHETNLQKHDYLQERLSNAMERKVKDRKEKLVYTMARLDGLSPLKIMSRGFSAVYDEKDNLVKNIEQVKENDKILIKLHDGQLDCTVNDVYKKEEE